MREQGFTIVESLAAVFLISMGLLGAFALISEVSSNTAGSLSRLTASYLAGEGIEIARNMRDSNLLKINRGEAASWDTGLSSCVAGCEIDFDDVSFAPYAGTFLKNNGTSYSYDSGTDTKFQRKITVTSPNAYTLAVTVDVYWQEKGRSLALQASTQLFKW